MAPHQIISLEDLRAPSFALADHYDHIHVGYTPPTAQRRRASSSVELLKPEQWKRLIEPLGEIDNPTVPTKPSQVRDPTRKPEGQRASGAHTGE